MGIDRKEAGKGVSGWRMTKRRIGGFLIKELDLDSNGEGWGTWSDMKGIRYQEQGILTKLIAGFLLRSGWQAEDRHAKVDTQSEEDSELEWNLVKRVSLSAFRSIVANPWLLVSLVGSLNTSPLPTDTPLHIVLFLNSLQLNHASNGCSLSWQPGTAGPTLLTDLLWGSHEMMCAKQLWKARIKEVISWLRGILGQCSVLCSNLGLATFSCVVGDECLCSSSLKFSSYYSKKGILSFVVLDDPIWQHTLNSYKPPSHMTGIKYGVSSLLLPPTPVKKFFSQWVL